MIRKMNQLRNLLPSLPHMLGEELELINERFQEMCESAWHSDDDHDCVDEGKYNDLYSCY